MKIVIVKSLLFTLFLIGFSFSGKSQEMSNQKIDSLLKTVVGETDGQLGNWQFIIGEVFFVCLTDETNNRMRIIAPIVKESEMEEGALANCMAANFHTALDVKYALSEGILWSVFIHPLQELSDDQFKDGLRQVYNAAVTYGDSYSSTELVFPSQESEQQRKENEEKEKKIKKGLEDS